MGLNIIELYFDRVPDRDEVFDRIRTVSGWHLKITPDLFFKSSMEVEGTPADRRGYKETIEISFYDRMAPPKSMYERILEAFPDDEQARQQKIAEFSHVADIYRKPEYRQDPDEKDLVVLESFYVDRISYLKTLTKAVLVEMGGRSTSTAARPSPSPSQLKWQGWRWWRKFKREWWPEYKSPGMLLLEDLISLFSIGRKKD